MTWAYYNEIEPYCAAWLRNLMAAGHIPAGEVDERDIREVRGDDLAGFGPCHFFGGIGGWAYAARLAGIPDDEPIWTASCPCPPFSSAGKRQKCPECKSRLLVWCPRRTGTQYARTAATLGLPTPATYGRKFGGWQPSAALNQSLANRLRDRLAKYGSPEYELRWKSSATVVGLPTCRLLASARRWRPSTRPSPFKPWKTPKPS